MHYIGADQVLVCCGCIVMFLICSDFKLTKVYVYISENHNNFVYSDSTDDDNGPVY